MPLFKVERASTYQGGGGYDYPAIDYDFSPPGHNTFLVPRVPTQWRAGLGSSQGLPNGMNANGVMLKTPRWYSLTQTQPGVARTQQAINSNQLRRYNLIEFTRMTKPASKTGM